ncbi:MAG: hypothetical protein AABY16_00225 [Nanoarchaeota archaeon]
MVEQTNDEDFRKATNGETYRKATKNILAKVKVKAKRDYEYVIDSPYKLGAPQVYVAGCLDFVSHPSFFALKGSGLYVYGSNDHLREDTFIPSMYRDLPDNKKIELLEQSDPMLLGLACEGLGSHHETRRALENGTWFLEQTLLHEASRRAKKDSPFSSELTKELTRYVRFPPNRRFSDEMGMIRAGLAVYDLEKKVILELRKMAIERRAL